MSPDASPHDQTRTPARRTRAHPGSLTQRTRVRSLATARAAAKRTPPRTRAMTTESPYTESSTEPRRSDHPSYKPFVPITTNNYGHVVWRYNTGKNRSHFPVHRLLAVSTFGFGAVAGNHVHHKNGIPWDNRPDNIEVMEPGEHARHHNSGHQTSNQDLIDDLIAGAIALGRPPTPTDIKRFGEHSTKTYYDRFGSWDAALEAAGLEDETDE